MRRFIHNYERAILVMGEYITKEFSISLDGSKTNNAGIVSPDIFYVADSPHAIVKNELFAFGGHSDLRKVKKKIIP